MKTILLKSLSYENWRGQTQSLNFDLHNVISGRNKSGKSTVFNAFLWLITGADDMDRSNYQIFDNTLPMTYENKKKSSVEAIIEIDGQEFTLAKTAMPGWTRKRGSSVYEKKFSDDYSFSVDGIEYSSGNYKKFIEENIAAIDKLKLMLNIHHFLLLDWKTLRKYFEDIIGEIKEDNMSGDYTEIKDLLIKYNSDTDNIRTELKSKINAIRDIMGTENKKGTLEVQIETLKSNLPDISGLEECRQKEQEAMDKLDEVSLQLRGSIESIRPYMEKRNKELAEIGVLEDEANKARSEYIKAFNLKVNKLEDEIAQINAKNKEIERYNVQSEGTHLQAHKQIEEYEKQLAVLNGRRLELLAQNKEVKALMFEGANCPYCGQPLPEDKLEKEREKFNKNKDEQHKAIVELGKSNNVRIENVKVQIAKLQEMLAEPFKLKAYINKSAFEKDLADLRASFIPYEETTDCKKRMAEIEEKQANLTVVPEVDNDVLQEEHNRLTDLIVTCRVKLSKKQDYDSQVEKIQKLEKEFKANATQLAKLEGKLFKVNEYEKEKAQLISDGVNKYFHFCHVEMTEMKKDGGLANTCLVKDNKGVNVFVTNTANRMLCGIDLSLGLQKHYGISLPIFIDDSELINKDNYPKIDNQTIKLKVSNTNFILESED